MQQKLDLQQLQKLSLGELKKLRDAAVKEKTEAEALKAKGGKSWTPEMQEELNNLALYIVDLDEAIDVKKEAETEEAPAPKKPVYEVKEGTEKMVHLKLVRGRRFNGMTGEEISEPFVQIFSYSEYQLFMRNYVSLGYTILEELHNPYKKD